MTFLDTDGVDSYSSEYTDLVQAHKEELNDLLENAPQMRLATVQAEYQQEMAMTIFGVCGAVQNTTMINQINTIVSALDKIMDVLILAVLKSVE